eukprot:1159117-Pelagomonas_calceolata.AAC.15
MVCGLPDHRRWCGCGKRCIDGRTPGIDAGVECCKYGTRASVGADMENAALMDPLQVSGVLTDPLPTLVQTWKVARHGKVVHVWTHCRHWCRCEALHALIPCQH